MLVVTPPPLSHPRHQVQRPHAASSTTVLITPDQNIMLISTEIYLEAFPDFMVCVIWYFFIYCANAGTDLVYI